MAADKCPACGSGIYTHGSAIYKYFSCGHAKDKIENKMVTVRSPYPPYNKQYKKPE